MQIIDEDMFWVNTSNLDYLNIALDHLESGIGKLEVFDANKELIYSDEFFTLPLSHFIKFSDNDTIFINVTGVANAEKYRTYYSLSVSASEIGITRPKVVNNQSHFVDGQVVF